MADEFRCGTPGRRQAIVDQTAAAGSRINAIDFLVVTDGALVPDGLKQRLLRLCFFNDDHLDDLTAAHVRVTGGVRISDPEVRWLVRLSQVGTPGGPLDPAFDPTLTAADRAFLAALRAEESEPERWLLVLLEEYGDFSRYTLSLRATAEGSAPPVGFDLKLSEVAFSFKVECPSPFDCASEQTCTTAPATAPPIDYLARDFNSFRQLMFDRLALTQPHEDSTDPATFRAVLVEVLAYSADHLSYYQDAVATEAYLGTARRRPSVRRHARLLDYYMHEGCNARTFVQLRLAPGLRVSGDPLVAAGARFITRVPDLGTVIDTDDLAVAEASAPEAFEALHELTVATDAHNAIALHTWGDGDCCLPRGAVTAALVDAGDRLSLAPGDFLAFEETRGRETALAEDADPDRRHVVRLTEVSDPFDDTLLGVRVVQVTWHEGDALPFPLNVTIGTTAAAVARGNLLLVDHGATVEEEPLDIASFGNQGRLRARLREIGLTFRQVYDPREDQDEGASGDEERAFRSAGRCLAQDPREATPAIALRGEGEAWSAQWDLLGSAASAREFVVEMESDGQAWLRFGDDVNGRKPAVDEAGLFGGDEPFLATYRVGNGTEGNVGAEAIGHIVADLDLVDPALLAAIEGVRNPVAAVGGVEPESLEDVRLFAPRAFRTQRRAVTEEDWAEVAARFAGVQRAVATIRWTGSYHTVFVSVDRVDGGELTAEFEADLIAFLERHRLAGYDLEVSGPSYVPLDVAVTVCVDPDHFRDVVERGLRQAFGTSVLADGTRGFFHPDDFTFGQSVYLSRIIGRAMAVPGVASVDVTPRSSPDQNDNRFKRWGQPQGGEIDDGRIRMGRLEIARCDNDPNAPDNGQIRFFMQGGA